MRYFFIELIKFIKINRKKVIFLSLIFSVFLIGTNFFINGKEISDDYPANDDQVSEEKNAEISRSSPAIFQFYIENQLDGTSYTNNWLIEQYLLRSENLEIASQNTNTKLIEKIEETNNTAEHIDENGEPLKILGIIRDGNSHLQTLYVNYGTEEENLKIAHYFQDIINVNKISFLADKNIYVFSEAHILNNNDTTSTTTSLPDLEEKQEEKKWLPQILEVVIIISISIVFSIIIIILYSYFSKKLTVYFFYKILDKDYFIIADEKLEYIEELKDIFLTPKNANKIILQENNEIMINSNFEEILEDSLKDNSAQVVNNFALIHNPEKIDRLIFIVNEGITTRKWYVKQRRYSEFFDIPTIVIQVNKSTSA